MRGGKGERGRKEEGEGGKRRDESNFSPKKCLAPPMQLITKKLYFTLKLLYIVTNIAYFNIIFWLFTPHTHFLLQTGIKLFIFVAGSVDSWRDAASHSNVRRS